MQNAEWYVLNQRPDLLRLRAGAAAAERIRGNLRYREHMATE